MTLGMKKLYQIPIQRERDRMYDEIEKAGCTLAQRVTPLENARVRLMALKEDVQRTEELIQLLEQHPEVERILELLHR